MAYQNPIDIITSKVNTMLEEKVLKAVQEACIQVDHDELVKALSYDRDQYRKGYNDRDSEIVRCKDCEHATMTSDGKYCKYCWNYTDDYDDPIAIYHEADFFCADGRRKD